MCILTEDYIKEALKMEAGEEWDAELQIENWDDDGDLKEVFDEVITFLAPQCITPEYKQVKITHSDNATNLSMFLDLYNAMSELEPIATIDEIRICEVNGKRYALEHCELGQVTIYHFE